MEATRIFFINPKLPKWIKSESEAMIGTKYTTKGFSTKRRMFQAISKFQHLGKWSYFAEGQWSDRAQKHVKRYVGVVRIEKGVKNANY